MPQNPLTQEMLEIERNVREILPPAALRADLVTTPDGSWAIEVQLQAKTAAPIREIEEAAGSRVKVVYTLDNPEMVARPAYPKRGE